MSATGAGFLAGYNVVATAVDWHVSPLSFVGAINATLTGLAICFLCVSSRKAECVIRMLFAILDLGTAFLIEKSE